GGMRCARTAFSSPQVRKISIVRALTTCPRGWKEVAACFSTSTTPVPQRPNAIAAARPHGPPPTTSTSVALVPLIPVGCPPPRALSGRSSLDPCRGLPQERFQRRAVVGGQVVRDGEAAQGERVAEEAVGLRHAREARRVERDHGAGDHGIHA